MVLYINRIQIRIIPLCTKVPVELSDTADSEQLVIGWRSAIESGADASGDVATISGCHTPPLCPFGDP